MDEQHHHEAGQPQLAVRRWRRWGVGVLAVTALLAGCGSDDESGDAAAEDVSEVSGGSQSGDDGFDGGAVGAEGEGDTEDAGEAAGDEAGGGGTGTPGDADVPIADLAAGPTAGRQVIRNARLSVESDDTVALVASVRQRVTALGGFVGAEELRSTEGGLVGTMTLRVPNEQLDTALEEIDGLGQVVQRSLDSEDVTDRLTDLDARLTNLRALETELNALLAETRERTSDASEVLRVFEQVNDVRLQVEVLDAQQAALRQRVGLATIVMDVAPTPEAVDEAPVVDEGWSPSDTLAAALGTTLVLGQALVDLAIWLVVVAGPVLVLLGLVWLALRAAGRRQPAARPSPPLEQEPTAPPPDRGAARPMA